MSSPIVLKNESPKTTDSVLENRLCVPAGVPQRVFDALADFITGKCSGVLEIHFSGGGFCQVVAKPQKIYK